MCTVDAGPEPTCTSCTYEEKMRVTPWTRLKSYHTYLRVQLYRYIVECPLPTPPPPPHTHTHTRGSSPRAYDRLIGYLVRSVVNNNSNSDNITSTNYKLEEQTTQNKKSNTMELRLPAQNRKLNVDTTFSFYLYTRPQQYV